MRPSRLLYAAVIACLLAFPAAAQDTLNYGQTVGGFIGSDAFFNNWTFTAQAGDDIEALMSARDGLLPLLGLLNPAGDLVARSPDGLPNDVVRLNYVIDQPGTYTLVATRVGNEQGTSTGGFSLTLRLAAQNGVVPGAREVSFRCESFEAVTLLTVNLSSELVTEGVPYRLRVYGLDGLRTLVRVQGRDTDLEFCRTGNVDAPGDIVFWPGEDPILIDDVLRREQFALSLSDPGVNGLVTVTIGSIDGAPGRYMAVLQGLSIGEAGEVDAISVQVGPRAAPAEVLAYAVADDSANSRLDPSLSLFPAGTDCDDAGRRGCDDIPSFAGAGVRILDQVTLMGDRFDAGMRLATDDLDAQGLEVGSFSGSTFGPYALFFLGSLPPL